MIVTRLRLRDFRTYATADVALGPGLTVVHGHNGAGKTNLLEGLYFACTGRSCRTTAERAVVRFDAPAARAEASVLDEEGREHELAVGFAPGEDKRLWVDGAPVERMLDVAVRPLISVFLPDRLELVKGPPALRRSHLDALVTGLWPSRAEHRRSYSRALAQRNALLARVRAGRGSASAIGAWDAELARHGIALREDRAGAVERIAEGFAERAADLGVAGAVTLRYLPRTQAPDAEGFAAELAERLPGDLERGFTGHGPHRDDLALLRDGRELKVYGSQGEQRLALLALLLAEREALTVVRGHAPLMLLDDVMSELDPERRGRLAAMLRRAGQSLITTTDLDHVPGGREPGVVRLAVAAGAVEQEPACVEAAS